MCSSAAGAHIQRKTACRVKSLEINTAAASGQGAGAREREASADKISECEEPHELAQLKSNHESLTMYTVVHILLASALRAASSLSSKLQGVSRLGGVVHFLSQLG